MFDDFLQEAKRDIDRIANAFPIPPHWTRTRIEITAMARATDPVCLSRENWWLDAEPKDSSGRAVIRLLDRALHLRDSATEEENRQYIGSGHASAAEVAEHQRDKEKNLNASARKNRSADDEGEAWRAYLGDPKDDAREWLKDLATKLDANGDNRGYFGTLRDHVRSQEHGAPRIGDLNQPLVEFCLRALCSE